MKCVLVCHVLVVNLLLGIVALASGQTVCGRFASRDSRGLDTGEHFDASHPGLLMTVPSYASVYLQFQCNFVNCSSADIIVEGSRSNVRFAASSYFRNMTVLSSNSYRLEAYFNGSASYPTEIIHVTIIVNSTQQPTSQASITSISPIYIRNAAVANAPFNAYTSFGSVAQACGTVNYTSGINYPSPNPSSYANFPPKLVTSASLLLPILCRNYLNATSGNDNTWNPLRVHEVIIGYNLLNSSVPLQPFRVRFDPVESFSFFPNLRNQHTFFTRLVANRTGGRSTFAAIRLRSSDTIVRMSIELAYESVIGAVTFDLNNIISTVPLCANTFVYEQGQTCAHDYSTTPDLVRYVYPQTNFSANSLNNILNADILERYSIVSAKDVVCGTVNSETGIAAQNLGPSCNFTGPRSLSSGLSNGATSTLAQLLAAASSIRTSVDNLACTNTIAASPFTFTGALLPGVYCSGGTFVLSGPLSVVSSSPEDVWIFKASSISFDTSATFVGTALDPYVRGKMIFSANNAFIFNPSAAATFVGTYINTGVSPTTGFFANVPKTFFGRIFELSPNTIGGFVNILNPISISTTPTSLMRGLTHCNNTAVFNASLVNDLNTINQYVPVNSDYYFTSDQAFQSGGYLGIGYRDPKQYSNCPSLPSYPSDWNENSFLNSISERAVGECGRFMGFNPQYDRRTTLYSGMASGLFRSCANVTSNLKCSTCDPSQPLELQIRHCMSAAYVRGQTPCSGVGIPICDGSETINGEDTAVPQCVTTGLQCQDLFPNRPYCSEEALACVGCRTGADCNPCGESCSLTSYSCNANSFANPCASNLLTPACIKTGRLTYQCVQCSSNSSCDDGQFCNGVEYCTANNTCAVTNVPVCPGGCNETTDQCLQCSSDSHCPGQVYTACTGGVRCNMTSNTCYNTSALSCPFGCNNITQVCRSCNTNQDCPNPFINGCFNGTTCNNVSGTCVPYVAPSCGTFGCNNATSSCFACSIDSHCDNGVYCDGVERCVNNTCVNGTALNCPGGCNEALDICYQCSTNSDCPNPFTFCGGGQICNSTTKFCQNVSATNCPFGCNATLSQCSQCNSTSNNCNDGQFCNGVEICVGGTCQQNTSSIPVCGLFCDTVNNVCVDCSTDSDCPNTWTTCDGGNKCNITTAKCYHAPPEDCLYGCNTTRQQCNVCNSTSDTCSDGIDCNGIEICGSDGLCTVNASTIPFCLFGCNSVQDTCINCYVDSDCPNPFSNCTGGEKCDTDLKQCYYVPPPSCPDTGCNATSNQCYQCATGNNTQCSDGLFCNGIETCVNNVCVPGNNLTCIGGCNETTDECYTCNVASDCGTVYTNCGGGFVCNSSKYCEYHAPINCSSSGCDTSLQQCYECNSDPQCYDNLFCNGFERCVSGYCAPANFTPICPGGCNETADICYQCATNNDCSNPYTPCAGGNICSSANKSCVYQPPINCSDFGCNVTSGTCFECSTNSHCDDGQYCNGVETCVANRCVAGIPPTCPGGCNETIDVCYQCASDNDCTPTYQNCTGGNKCNLNTRTCYFEPGPVCSGNSVCNSTTDACEGCVDNTDCDNSKFCDGLEYCAVGGVCLTNSTTIPSCPFGCNETSDACNQCSTNSDCGAPYAPCLGGYICNMPALTCSYVPPLNCGSNFCDNITASCYECVTDNDCDSPWQPCVGGDRCNSTSRSCYNIPPTPCAYGCNTTSDTCFECSLDAHCDDGIFCNGQETCVNNTCQIPAPLVCPGGCNETTNECYECSQTSDCSTPYLPCYGGNKCNTLTKECYFVQAVACGLYGCDNNTDLCYQCYEDSQCDNGLFCDGVEKCSAGTCVPGTPPNCGTFGCNEQDNYCYNCNSDSDCSLPIFSNCSTGNKCDLDTRLCELVIAPSCGLYGCNSSSNTCFQCSLDFHCDDGLYCNGAETCVDNKCVSGTPISCPTTNGCSEIFDSCNPCTATHECLGAWTPCSGGNVCNTGTGVCEPTPPLTCVHGCDNVTNACRQCSVASDCGSSNFCTGDWQCTTSGTCEFTFRNESSSPCLYGCDPIREVCTPFAQQPNIVYSFESDIHLKYSSAFPDETFMVLMPNDVTPLGYGFRCVNSNYTAVPFESLSLWIMWYYSFPMFELIRSKNIDYWGYLPQLQSPYYMNQHTVAFYAFACGFEQTTRYINISDSESVRAISVIRKPGQTNLSIRSHFIYKNFADTSDVIKFAKSNLLENLYKNFIIDTIYENSTYVTDKKLYSLDRKKCTRTSDCLGLLECNDNSTIVIR